MPTLTVPILDEDVAFLTAYSATQGLSVEQLIARQAHNLKVSLAKPLHRDVQEATGIIKNSADGEAMHRAHLEKKHA